MGLITAKDLIVSLQKIPPQTFVGFVDKLFVGIGKPGRNYYSPNSKVSEDAQLLENQILRDNLK